MVLAVTLVTTLVAVARGASSTAVLALVGVLFTEAVALVGALLRDAAESRTLALAKADSERIAASERENAELLRMETTLRGVEVISPEASVTRNSAALLALTELGRPGFAVALLNSLWPQDLVSAEAATQVISAALRSGDDRLQRTAAAVLSDNAERTYPGIGTVHYMPHEVQEWDTSLQERVRLSFAAYLAKVIRHLTVDAGEADRNTFHQLTPPIAALRAAISRDPSDAVVSDALIILNAVLPIRALMSDVDTLEGHDGQFSLEVLAEEVVGRLAEVTSRAAWFVDSAGEIRIWWEAQALTGES